MRRPNKTLLILLMSGSSAAMGAETMSAKQSLCGELVEAANQAALAHRGVGSAAADQVTSGESLDEKACLGDLKGFDFDLFASIPSFSSSILKEAKNKAIDEMTNMACSAAQEAVESANTLLTCTAAVGVKLNAQAGFDSLDPEECGGIGLDAEIDGGSHSFGGSGTTTGGSVNGTGGVGASGEAGAGEGADRGSNSGVDSWDSWVN